jgi:L-alanine-DL-glutamate epimerase-like enolase superfamily enzyme
MKIRDITAVGLSGATPAGGWQAELKPDDGVHTIITVHTDDGVTGYGSVFTTEALVRSSLSVLEPFFLDESALEPERLSEKLHQSTFWLGRGGAITHTISGIDTALWDILGKATGQPMGRLMGGRYRERVRPYASLLMSEPRTLQDTLAGAMASGFTAFKIGWGPFGRHDDRLDEEIVAAARDTIGASASLMVDAGGSEAFWRHGLKWALRTADMLDAYAVSWFEEPLRPDAIEDYRELRLRSRVPISGGEVLTRRQSFVPWIQTGAVDILQPDVTKVGGPSELRRVAWMAQENGIRVIPHGWNTAVGLATDLQLASALPGTDMVEYITGSPYVDELTTDGWQLDTDGMLRIPDGPGLGITIDEERLAWHSRQHSPVLS